MQTLTVPMLKASQDKKHTRYGFWISDRECASHSALKSSFSCREASGLKRSREVLHKEPAEGLEEGFDTG